MDTPTPIKRDPALVRFSKDHHHGLLLVWKIRRGLSASVDPKRIASYVVWFFDNSLTPHFEDEEVNLFPRLNYDDEMRLRAERDHTNARNYVDSFRRDEPNPEMLSEFADLLEAHIRFEERELFNRLQEYLSKEELNEILEAEDSASCMTGSDWKDEFWK